MKRVVWLWCLVGVSCGSGDAMAGLEAEPDLAGGALELHAPYYESVTAEGSGCPDTDSWQVEIDPLGEVFTLTFSQLEAMLAPMEPEARRECSLDFALGSGARMQLAVNDVHDQGYVYLEPGVSARQELELGLSDSETRSVYAVDYAGPVDESYVLSGSIQSPISAWTRCQAGGHLTIKTSIALTNDAEMSGAGYMNILATDATATFKLRWRHCHR